MVLVPSERRALSSQGCALFHYTNNTPYTRKETENVKRTKATRQGEKDRNAP